MAWWFGKTQKVSEVRIELEQLEPRIVLDASVDAVSQPDSPDSQDANDLQDPEQSPESNASPAQSPEAAGDVSGDDPLGDLFNQSLDVVLISDSIDEIGAIKDAAGDSAEVIVYDSQTDDIESIVEDLGTLVDGAGAKIGHLAILSHGDPGVLEISELSVISATSIENNPEAWMELGTLLTEDAKIDLYGRQIGAGSEGTALVEAMASTTSSEVWASDDSTGLVDWDLEIRSAGSSKGYLLDHTMLAGQGIELGDALVNPSFELEDFQGWTVVDYDGAQYYFGATTLLQSGTTVGFQHQVYDYADQTDVYIYPFADQTYNATDGNYLMAQLSNGPQHATISQDFTLANGMVVWDMSYDMSWFAEYVTETPDFSANQFVSVSLIPDSGDPVVLFTTQPGDSTSFAQTNMFGDASDLYGQDVTLQIEIYGSLPCFLDVAFDNFRLADNGQPTAFDQTKNGFEDEAMLIALGGNDGDPDLNQTLTYIIDSLPSNGALYATEADALAGTGQLSVGDALDDNTLWYKTDANDNSDTSFTFYTQDNGGAINPGDDTSDIAEVELIIEPVNDDPIAIDGTVTTSGTIRVTLHGYDADNPDVSDVSFDVDPTNTAHGKVKYINGETIQTDGNGNYYLEVEYDPDNNFTGTDEIFFTFQTPGGDWVGFETGNGDQFGIRDWAQSYDLEVGDINGDGFDDVIAATAGAPNYYYLGDGPGNFSNGIPVSSQSTTSVVVQLGDLNGDGFLDAAFRNSGVADTIYFWDPVNELFSSAVTLANSSDGGYGSIGFGDVDGDGDLDIAVAKNYGSSLLYINDGSGNFDAGTVLNTGSGTVSTMDMGDVDGDGYADIVVGKYRSDNALLLSDGEGGFQAPIDLPAPTGQPRQAQYIDIGDVDGDGDIDIIVANDGNGSRGIDTFYRNNSNQGFDSFDIGTGDDSVGARLADVDNDGDLDALFGNRYGDPNLYYLFDSDTGQFGSGVQIGRQIDTIGVEIIDYDSDGDMDFIGATAAGNWRQNERVYENLGFNDAVSNQGVITVTVTSASQQAAVLAPQSLTTMDVAGSPTSTTTTSDFTTTLSDTGLSTTSGEDFDLMNVLTPVALN